MMTNKEAHEFLEELQIHLTLYRKMYSNELIEANGKAIEALEKQIPKKPLKRSFDYSELKGKSYYENYDDFLCPSCKKRIISNINGGWVAGRRQKYCDKCGQALDWEGIKG